MVVKGHEVVGTKVQNERWGQVNRDPNNQSIARLRLALAVRPVDDWCIPTLYTPRLQRYLENTPSPSVFENERRLNGLQSFKDCLLKT
jgi:hypothetical protein